MRCVKLSDNTVYAVKIYKRQNHNVNEVEVLLKAAAKRLRGVLRLFEVLTDSKWTYLIMEEEIDGVDLIEYFSTNSHKRKMVSTAFNALWDIVKRVHALKYAHGRICFKNVCYLKKSSEFRLIGFSNAKPIKREHDKHIDYWSLGVCIYTVLCGHSPFDVTNRNVTAMTHQIQNDEFDQESVQWHALHKDSKRFIRRLISSPKPTFSKDELKKIDKLVPVVNFTIEQIEQNENIVAIRAAKFETKPTIKTEEIPATVNGQEIIANGNDGPIESHESQSEHIGVNGHVAKTAGKRRHNEADFGNKPNINQVKKRKQDPVESLSTLQFDERTMDRPLRKREHINYAHTLKLKLRNDEATVKVKSVPSKEAEEKRIEDERISHVLSVATTAPTNATNKTTIQPTRGRPKKGQPNVSKAGKEKRTPQILEPTTQPIVEIDEALRWRFYLPIPRPSIATNYCFERYNYK